MLNHTKKIRELYEDIQKKLFYMIPEKWDKLFLYTSVVENSGEYQTGELFFYYIPKGILRKNPVSVYEIPNKFNLDENEYLRLVDILYSEIKVLREEFKRADPREIWSNITISIQNSKFKVEYGYEDLQNNEYSSYERHIIWRYKYLGIGPEQVNKEDRAILKRYFSEPKTLKELKKEEYDAGIYIKEIENMVDFNTTKVEENIQVEEEENIQQKKKNQILLSQEEIEKINNDKKNGKTST